MFSLWLADLSSALLLLLGSQALGKVQSNGVQTTEGSIIICGLHASSFIVLKFSKPGGDLRTLCFPFVCFRLSPRFSSSCWSTLFFSGLALPLSDGAAPSDSFPTTSPEEVSCVLAAPPPSVVPWVLAVENLPPLDFPLPRLADLGFSPWKFCDEPLFLLPLLTFVTAFSRLSEGVFTSVSSRVWELSDLSSFQSAKPPSRFLEGFTGSFFFSLCSEVFDLLLVNWRFLSILFPQWSDLSSPDRFLVLCSECWRVRVVSECFKNSFLPSDLSL